MSAALLSAGGGKLWDKERDDNTLDIDDFALGIASTLRASPARVKLMTAMRA